MGLFKASGEYAEFAQAISDGASVLNGDSNAVERAAQVKLSQPQPMIEKPAVECVTVSVLDDTDKVLSAFSTCSPLIEGNNPTGLETQPGSGLMERLDLTLASDNGGSKSQFNFESPSVEFNEANSNRNGGGNNPEANELNEYDLMHLNNMMQP